MAAKTKKIRDFIYLDGDKLYSLYSQVNEGLANQIIQSKLKGEQQTKSQKSAVGEGGAVESQFSDLIHSTESKVLHDYMYAELEEQIKDSINEPKDITNENYREKLGNTFLIKVKGNAEIADYARLKQILDKVNKMAEGIAYMQEFEKLGMSVFAAKTIVNSMKNGKEKSDLQKFVKRFENPKELAREIGLLQDEKQMEILGFFTELFYLGEIELIIKTKFDGDDNTFDFRGLLNKEWLRIKPEPLRMLYGGYSEFDWTMVAQITYIPNPERVEPIIFSAKTSTTEEGEEKQSDEEKQKELEETAAETSEEKPQNSMRDALLNMSRAARGLETTFMSSNLTTEIVVSPLAIYRETEIVISE